MIYTYTDSLGVTWQTLMVQEETFLPSFRIVWDDENPDYDYKCRTQQAGWDSAPTPPAVMRHYPVAKDGAGEYRTDITAWKQIFLNLGNDEQDFSYWTHPAVAQFNRTGWPKLANVTFSGNAVKVLEEIPGWVKVETLKNADPGRAKGMTRITHPHLIHTFTCVGWKDGKTIRVPSTNTARGVIDFPFVTDEGFAWMPARHIVKA